MKSELLRVRITDAKRKVFGESAGKSFTLVIDIYVEHILCSNWGKHYLWVGILL